MGRVGVCNSGLAMPVIASAKESLCGTRKATYAVTSNARTHTLLCSCNFTFAMGRVGVRKSGLDMPVEGEEESLRGTREGTYVVTSN